MDYKKHLRNWERQFETAQQNIELLYQDIGQDSWTVSAIVESLEDNKEYMEVIQHARGLLKQKDRATKTLAKIEEFEEEIRERMQEIADKNNDIKDLRGEMKNTHQSIGSGLFDLYTRTPQQYIHYHADLLRVEELFRKRYEIEIIVDLTAADEKRFPQRVVKRIKQQMFKIRLARNKNEVEKLFEQIGTEVSAEWLNKPGTDKKLAEILSEVIAQHEKISENQKIINKYQSEILNIQARQDKLIENQKVGAYKKKLHIITSESEAEYNTLIAQSGQLVFEGLRSSPPEKLAASFINLKSLLNEQKQIKEIIHRLHVAETIVVLEKRRANGKQREEQIRQHIAELELELQKLNESIKIIDVDIDSQKKIRGSEQDLVSSS